MILIHHYQNNSSKFITTFGKLAIGNLKNKSELFSGERAFTVFAPVNKAFEELPQNIQMKIKNNSTFAIGQGEKPYLLFSFLLV